VYEVSHSDFLEEEKTMSEIKLLPCPFCGSRNIDPEGYWAEQARPVCEGCNASADSAEKWNKRTTGLPPISRRELALIAAAEAFIKKVDEGNARSKRSYAEFKEALQIPMGETFQDRIWNWMLDCFNLEIALDQLERSDRFLEEALELVQSGNYSAARAHTLVDYVFNRQKGEMPQEVGGVMVTLAAFCCAHGIDAALEGEIELFRINQPETIQKIRAKQAAKPKGSALPRMLDT
jgi:hypothetical protein